MCAPTAAFRTTGILPHGLNTTAISPGGTTHVRHRTETRRVSEEPAWLVSRTFYDPKGLAVVTADLFVEDASVTASNAAAFNPETGTYGSFSFDNAGRVTMSTDQFGRQTHTAYNSFGETIETRTESNYDAEGRLQETWANIRVVVDAQGNVLSTSYADKQVTAFEYDAYGRTTKTIYGVGTPIESYVAQGYDDYGRVIWESEQALAGETSPLKRQFEYNDFGRLTAVVLPEAAHPTLTDGQNPLIVRPRYEYAYDARGNHVSIRDNVYQIGAGIFYDHGGAAGDFSQAFDTRVTVFTYDDQGRQTSRTLPLGVATPADPDDFVERSFHSDRSLAAAVAGGGRLAGKYFYGGASAVAAYLADAADGSLTDVDEAVKYGYDAFGRQVQVIQDGDGDFTTAGDQRVTITAYDIYGNIAIVASRAGVLHYAYDPVTGQQTRVWTGTDSNAPITDTRYVYDILGRLDAVESHDYTFNLQGRMDSAEVSRYDSAGTTLEQHERETYEYDNSGIRAARTVAVDVNTDGDFDDAGTDTTTWTDYHVDKNNHTGYAQVLEEMQGGAVRKILDDRPRRLPRSCRRQSAPPPAQGRPWVNAAARRCARRRHLKRRNSPSLRLRCLRRPHRLHTGERVDSTALQRRAERPAHRLGYFRARYYNPATSTFNRLDPLFGNFNDPQSLHDDHRRRRPDREISS